MSHYEIKADSRGNFQVINAAGVPVFVGTGDSNEQKYSSCEMFVRERQADNLLGNQHAARNVLAEEKVVPMASPEKLKAMQDAQAMAKAIISACTFLMEVSHSAAKNGGWWNDVKTGEPLERNKGELIALMHSELSEALEGFRKDKMDDHLPHRKSGEVELADTLIRIFDFAGGFNLDLGGAFFEKIIYNSTRQDHKPENRAKEDGKKF